MTNRYIYNMGQAFHITAERYSERPALLMLDGTSMTYGELDRAAAGTAAQTMGDAETDAIPPDWKMFETSHCRYSSEPAISELACILPMPC